MLDDYTVLEATPKCCVTCVYFGFHEAPNGRRYWGCSDVSHVDAPIPEVTARGRCSNWWDKYSQISDDARALIEAALEAER